MADFVQTMKDWRRICDHYTTDDEESCCNDCPMRDLPYDDHGCDAIFSDWSKNADWEEVEAVVMKWAAEHPEPVYPTWFEWLEDQRIVATGKSGIYDSINDVVLPTLKMFDPIPADIAEKLGIEPKEG